MLKPGDLALVDHDKGEFNKTGGLYAARGEHDAQGVWLTVPFIVLAVFPQDSIYDHNVILLGKNGAIGWLPEIWVTNA